MKFVWSMQHSNILVFFRGKIVDKITIFSYWFQAFSKKSYLRCENERAHTHQRFIFFSVKKTNFVSIQNGHVVCKYMALIGGINFQQWNVFAMLSFIQLNEKDDRCAKIFHKWFFFFGCF